jgi:hypothetical protein
MPCCSGYQCHVQVLVWAMHHVLGASHKAPTYTGISCTLCAPLRSCSHHAGLRIVHCAVQRCVPPRVMLRWVPPHVMLRCAMLCSADVCRLYVSRCPAIR